MTGRAASLPAFGEADLSNCEREQIHLAGSIQPHGALLVVREADHVVVQSSANAASFLGLSGSIVGLTLGDLGGDLAVRVLSLSDDALTAIPVGLRCEAGRPARNFDVQVHRLPESGLALELEPIGPPVDLSRHVDRALKTILGSYSLRSLCDETARIFRDLTGYDRVMVYRFDEERHGEVFSEQCRPDLEAFVGNRYPASDIPQIARRLYVRNRVRVLVDVNFTPSPVTPRLSPLSGDDLDMSLCVLRSSSPIHVQYLKNMGVRATLVVSLVVGGKLWGLVSCHHYEPRLAHFEVRAVCELLAEAVATRIAALESFVRGQGEMSVRRLEQRMIEALSRDGDWCSALFDGSQSLLQPLAATGAALLFDGQILTTGDVPGTPSLREIGAWLDAKPRATVYNTASLGRDVPSFEALIPVASGVMATPVSSIAGEYMLWFRPERVRTVIWGGDPFKPALVGNDPATLSPRRSFAQWHQLVEGTCDPWTAADITAAHLIGNTVADVILQSRSVRMLIAQDQLDQVRHQVGGSDQPVVIADAAGRILLLNEAFRKLVHDQDPGPEHVHDLGELLLQPMDARHRLRELLRNRRPWRGEVSIGAAGEDARPMLIRADPIFSSPDRVLGFVFLFTDLAERKRAEAARRRFQEGILDGHRSTTERLDVLADPLFQNILSSVVENAQLAALEITDSVDTSSMPEMLESVRGSVARTAEVLEHLIRHATRDDATEQ